MAIEKKVIPTVYEDHILDVETGNITVRPWTEEEIEKIKNEKPSVPKEIDARQLRLALLEQGKLKKFQSNIETGDESIKINWEYGTSFKRNNFVFQNILGTTDDETDDLFRLASEL
jgi:hypothetical protein